MLTERFKSTAATETPGSLAGQILRAAFVSRLLLLLLVGSSFTVSVGSAALAQGGDHMLLGDVKVEESEAKALTPMSFDIILYNLSGVLVSRQTVPNNGRYRFLNLSNGHYDVAVEVENREVARVRVFVFSRFKSDFRQDFTLGWRSDFPGNKIGKAQTVSAADFYTRTPANQSLFERAQQATDKKEYQQAVSLLKQLLAADAKDFQAWTELGTMHLILNAHGEAEEAYRRAVAIRPKFSLALLNMGRLLIAQKKYEAAVEPLARAVAVQPTSAEAQHLLGEAYLQLKQGSKAVPYLNEAARLGRTEAHLRLATLYNAAGMKDRAAAEYEQFLTKEPNHPDREKLRRYIEKNKKR